MDVLGVSVENLLSDPPPPRMRAQVCILLMGGMQAARKLETNLRQGHEASKAASMVQCARRDQTGHSACMMVGSGAAVALTFATAGCRRRLHAARARRAAHHMDGA